MPCPNKTVVEETRKSCTRGAGYWEASHLDALVGGEARTWGQHHNAPLEVLANLKSIPMQVDCTRDVSIRTLDMTR